MTRKVDPGGLVFEDGPAAGVTLGASRAPHFLRVVQAMDDRVAREPWDVLDQLHDTPRPHERVHVYEAVGPTFDPDLMARQGTFLCPRPGASGRYRHRPDVDGEQLRSIDAWRAWARAQPLDRPMLDGVTLERRDPIVPTGA